MCIGVDDQDRPLKPLSKKEAHLIKGQGPVLHRAFSVFLFDEGGHLLLQRRADAKITFPDVWTNTCCSHPLFNPFEMGEDAKGLNEEAAAVVGCKRAAIRKLEHELGIPASAFAPEELTYSTLDNECVRLYGAHLMCSALDDVRSYPHTKPHCPPSLFSSDAHPLHR